MYGNVDIGKGTVIQCNVILGNRDDGILVVGDNSLIRSGTVIYSSVTIGRKFRTGHNVLIRENINV